MHFCLTLYILQQRQTVCVWWLRNPIFKFCILLQTYHDSWRFFFSFASLQVLYVFHIAMLYYLAMIKHCALAVAMFNERKLPLCIFATGAQPYLSPRCHASFYGHVQYLRIENVVWSWMSHRANSLRLRKNIRLTRSRETASRDGQRPDPVDRPCQVL